MEPIITYRNYYENLPNGWSISNLKSITSKIVDGNHNPPCGLTEKTKYLMLSSQNIGDNQIINLHKVRYLSEEQFKIENKRTNICINDILFTSVGTIGRSCIYNGELNISFQRSVSVMTSLINPEYIKLYLDAPKQQDYFIRESSGTAQKGFYLNQLSRLFVLIPPCLEQNRIVSKVKHLFSQI